MKNEGSIEGMFHETSWSSEPTGSAAWDSALVPASNPKARRHRAANNPFAQGVFDCRDVLLPKGKGKDGQRRRSNLRAILFTIATQGEWSNSEHGRKNGLWWPTARIASRNGIGIHQTEVLLHWLVNVGLVHRKRQFNRPSILWVDFDRLREICQRQQDDREAYQELVIQQRESSQFRDVERVPEYDPEDLEQIYFGNELPSEALTEAPSEPLPEAVLKRQAEARRESLGWPE